MHGEEDFYEEDEVNAADSWQQHIERNESYILDLFHGQLKSTLFCRMCKTASIKYDAFSTVTLPIPAKKYEELTLFYQKYVQDADYDNYRLAVKIKADQTVYALRQKVESQFGFKAGSFIVSWVCDN